MKKRLIKAASQRNEKWKADLWALFQLSAIPRLMSVKANWNWDKLVFKEEEKLESLENSKNTKNIGKNQYARPNIFETTIRKIEI